MSVIVAIFILGFIIFIHELGHFLVAKFFKVPVREFSIGMGPRIYSKVWKNTRYSLKAFPFGGSCAMIGEDAAGSGDFTSVEGVTIDEEGLVDFEGVKFDKKYLDENNFAVISPMKKFLISLSGPFMNFLLAYTLSIVLVMQSGFDVPIISNISEGSAATEAKPISLEKNDEIIGLEIPSESEKVIAYRDIVVFMQLNNKEFIEKNVPLAITFKRNGETYKTIVRPKIDRESGRAIIGISFGDFITEPKNVIEVLNLAGRELYFYIKTTIMSLKLLFRGRLNANDISGPVGTVAVMGSAINEASAYGIGSILYTLFTLTVLISANLGVMNLLPIPALDGGRIVFAAIEMIIGRPIDNRIEGYVNTVTMILLLMFMVWIFGMDIYKLFTGTLY